MQISTHTIGGIELFDVKRINRATIADGNLLNTYVYEPLIQNEDILASAIGSLSGKANYALCSVDDYPLTISQLTGIEFSNHTTKGITWSTVDNRLEIPSTVKLIDVNFECELLLSSINNVNYGDLVFGIYQDNGLLEEKTFEIDLSKERHLVNFTTKMLDVSNLQFFMKSPVPATANIRVGVNDESSTAGGGGSSGIEDVTTSGSYLRTSAGWLEYNEPDPCTLCCENFVEWNFNRQSTDDMLANPLLALCDTSGTPSGTLNAGDKYMLYLDGLLGQSANNNTYVNVGIQSGTASGQYLMSEPLPSKKLCRSTSTGNDFACSFMFTVPTNGSYSVAIQPTQNNQEYKFFGNTTIRQIKIG